MGKRFGGSHADGGIGISGDADGNVYLAAYFNSDIVFIGGLEAMNAGMESTDFFLAKFDGDGNEIWVQSGGGTGNDSVLDLITDADGNSYLTGYFFSSTMKVGSITLNNSGNTDIFVVKYNNEGVAQWAKAFGNDGFEQAEGIAIDGDGNSYITGFFGSEEIDFGAVTLENRGINDIFLTKLDADGNVAWAVVEGGDMFEGATGISVNDQGEIFITGYFGTDEIQFGDTVLTNTGIQTIFTAKYNSDGSVAWAKSGEGSNMDMSEAVFADNFGNVYITGYIDSDEVDFDGIVLNNQGAQDVFLVQYDSEGQVIHAENYGGSGSETGRSIAVDKDGNLFLAGHFASSTLSFGDHSVSNSGDADVFLAKINSGFVGIEDVNADYFTMYPNPSSGMVRIESQYQIEKISMYNSMGTRVFEAEIDNKKAELDLSSYSNGIYFLTIQNENNAISKKLILNR